MVKHKAVDGIFTGSDVGTQMGMVMSPDTWRKFFKPGYKKYGVYTRKMGFRYSTIPAAI
ncbi:MAG: hypothetical protein U5N58_07125 [Actinomycetota bacterium]|nr:hypothetical protein [Actinomycetota bacterium]